MTRPGLTPAGEFHPQLHSRRMRPTQVAAFRKIKDEGLLSPLRMRVYEIIFEHQTPDMGVTSGEIDRIMSRDKKKWTRSASPRLSELVRLGVIEELPVRACRATGATVIAYRTTDQNTPDTKALRDAKEVAGSRVKRPSKNQIRNVVEQMRAASRKGFLRDEDSIVVAKWLISISEDEG